MNYEYEIKQIKAQLQNLQEIVLRMSRSNMEEVSKREQTTNGLGSAEGNIDQNTADIEYIAMMTDVDLEEGE